MRQRSPAWSLEQLRRQRPEPLCEQQGPDPEFQLRRGLLGASVDEWYLAMGGFRLLRHGVSPVKADLQGLAEQDTKVRRRLGGL